MRKILLIALVLAAAPAQAEEPDESSCGPGGVFAASTALSAVTTGVGFALVAEAFRNAPAGDVALPLWNGLIPPLASVPAVAWLAPGKLRWDLTLGLSMSARLVSTLPFVLLDATKRLNRGDAYVAAAIVSSLVGAAVETVLEYEAPKPRPGHGVGVRLGVATMSPGAHFPFEPGAPAVALEYDFRNRHDGFAHGPFLSLAGAVEPLRHGILASLDGGWRAEWLHAERDGLGPFAAVSGLAGLGTAEQGDFNSGLRVGAGGELGWRFPMSDGWHLEALLQVRGRLAILGNPFFEWENALLLGFE